MSPSSDKPESYEAAISELREILMKLERQDPDVDALAAQVERASTLIQFCKERVSKAEMKVNELMSPLSPDDEDADQGDQDADEDADESTDDDADEDDPF